MAPVSDIQKRPNRPKLERMPEAEAEAAFRGIYDRYYDELWRYAARRMPADVVAGVLSDIFLVVWRRLVEVPPEPQTRTWLYVVGRHCIANHRRGQRRQLRLVGRLGRTEPKGGSTAEGSGERIRRVLVELPEHDQELLRLLYWEELSNTEVAAVLGISANAVAIRGYRARKRLGDLLNGQRKTKEPNGHEEAMQEAINDEQ